MHILFLGNPPKILRDIVCSVPVNMVYDEARSFARNKHLCNKPMSLHDFAMNAYLHIALRGLTSICPMGFAVSFGLRNKNSPVGPAYAVDDGVSFFN